MVVGSPVLYYPASYASTVLAAIVCLFVCPSQVRVVQRRLNLGSHKQRHTIAHGLLFPRAKNLREIPTTSPQIQVGRFKSAIFYQYQAVSQKQCTIVKYLL